MKNNVHGYYGKLLDINLTTRKTSVYKISEEDLHNFVGGRGLGVKLLWDRIKKPGLDAYSPENPLVFLTGPFSGFPIPSASRICIVTKSPTTMPIENKKGSTVTYTNMGGLFGPELHFTGFDGIIITGKASSPVSIVIEDEKVEIQDAKKYWGMKTDDFDKAFAQDLGDKNFQTCYIGPAGENRVPFACIIHTAARAAGRGGAGAVMGSKNLKAIAVKGSKQPKVADHVGFLEEVQECRDYFNGLSPGTAWKYLFKSQGTAFLLENKSGDGRLAVKNFREGTFKDIENIGAKRSREKIWKRDIACYCCPIACKKSGVVKKGKYATIVHDGPEYETGTMFGSNLMISNLEGLMKAIYDGDDYGLDIISTGNIIGFLMEAYEKKLIDKKFLDGIDLKWGNVDAVIKMIKKIALRQGIGDKACAGVSGLANLIGKESEKFAIHVKGLEIAAHNIHADHPKAISYATGNKGGSHQTGDDVREQNARAVIDSLGICKFATDMGKKMAPGLDEDYFAKLMTAITGEKWTGEDILEAGERIFNLEKMFNSREGFTKKDDVLPDRFFDEPLTIGPEEGAVLTREKFNEMLQDYYKERGWDLKTSKPLQKTLKRLKLSFV